MHLFVLVYRDDILLFSRSPEEHEQHLRVALDLLRKEDFYANLSQELPRSESTQCGQLRLSCAGKQAQ